MKNLNRIKNWLYGSAFTRLMENKKTNKYRIARGSGLSYQSLLNWEASRNKPNDKSALAVAGYLGLIPEKDQIAELERDAADIKAKLERLK